MSLMYSRKQPHSKSHNLVSQSILVNIMYYCFVFTWLDSTKDTVNFLKAERITMMNPSLLFSYFIGMVVLPCLTRGVWMEKVQSAPFPISLPVPSPNRRCLIIQNPRCCWDSFHKLPESLGVQGQCPLMVSPLILPTMFFMHAPRRVEWLPVSPVSLLPLANLDLTTTLSMD